MKMWKPVEEEIKGRVVIAEILVIANHRKDRDVPLPNFSGDLVEHLPLTRIVTLKDQIAQYDKECRVLLSDLLKDLLSCGVVLLPPRQNLPGACSLCVANKNEKGCLGG